MSANSVCGQNREKGGSRFCRSCRRNRSRAKLGGAAANLATAASASVAAAGVPLPASVSLAPPRSGSGFEDETATTGMIMSHLWGPQDGSGSPRGVAPRGCVVGVPPPPPPMMEDSPVSTSAPLTAIEAAAARQRARELRRLERRISDLYEVVRLEGGEQSVNTPVLAVQNHIARRLRLVCHPNSS